jgi:hypothetical protein
VDKKTFVRGHGRCFSCTRQVCAKGSLSNLSGTSKSICLCNKTLVVEWTRHRADNTSIGSSNLSNEIETPRKKTERFLFSE